MNDTPKPPLEMLSDSPSAFNRFIGIEIADWGPGRATMFLDLRPEHLNRSGRLHGGVIATMIDAVGGYAGCYCPHPGRVRRAASISIDARYLAPGLGTGRVTAEGVVRGGGGRTFFATAEVRHSDGSLLAIGDGVYVYFKGSEGPEGVPV